MAFTLWHPPHLALPREWISFSRRVKAESETVAVRQSDPRSLHVDYLLVGPRDPGAATPTTAEVVMPVRIPPVAFVAAYALPYVLPKGDLSY